MERFKAFSKKEIVDTTNSAEAIFCLSAECLGQVDELVNMAMASGGKSSSDPQDHGFMYGWSFQDLESYLGSRLYG